jgi:anti-sigma-K factor RskA
MDSTEVTDTRSPSAQSSGVSGYWRAGTYFCLLLLAIAAAAGVSMFEQFSAQIRDLQQKVQQTAQLQTVAVLLDDKGQAALLLTQVSGESVVQLQRLNAVVEGGEDSMQLWALTDAAAPRSLGVLTPKLKTLRLTVGEQAMAGVQQLAISVENRGGVSQAQGPRLPYLFTGALVRKAL